MRRRGVGMRWWLGLAFALISGLTAVTVALVFSERAQNAFQERSDVLALGNAVAAGEGVRRAFLEGTESEELNRIALNRQLSLYIFDAEGQVVSSAEFRAITLDEIPDLEAAVAAALENDRYVATLGDGSATIVTLPLRGVPGAAAMLAYVPQPEVATSIGIFRREILVATAVAFPVGALVGLFVAWLIAARLRRVAAAAVAIEAGNFDLEVRPRFRDEVGSLGITIDRMRERLRDSFRLLESERDRLGRLLERLHDGVIMIDRAMTVEFANAAARRAFGETSLVIGRPLPEPWEALSLNTIAAGLFRPGAQLVQARVAPDDQRTYAVVGIPAGPDAESAVVVLTDISEQERRERAEREFVANAAHELRTPLAAITGAVDVLQAGAKETPVERDLFLGHIQRESARLGRLARALLVLARAQTGQEAPQLAPTKLRPILESVASGANPGPGVELNVRCARDLEALTEPDLVEQIVANLAANAVKHTERGSIDLIARRDRNGMVVLEVSDTGPGIGMLERERIFDRFYRGGNRSREGFGLGLSIVSHAARALGGVVDVRSAPGEGTTIRVTLPGSVGVRPREAGLTPDRVAASAPHPAEREEAPAGSRRRT